ncbi:Ca-transporting ATPase [Auriculariales sp. MPI-PUGE-AT-0066]|nr:Ca-transporting ATPase [Auriculariales sp. MPI-PUGE-AT-0066]
MSTDYTDGASPADIENALNSERSANPRRRRESSLGTSYVDDTQTAIFGGSSHSVMPSSATTMVRERPMARRLSRSSTGRSRRRSGVSESSERDRLRGSRRMSTDSQVLSDNEYASEAEGDAAEDSRSARGRRSRRSPDQSLEAEPRSFFDNWANLFSARHPESPSRPASLSRRSSGHSSRRRRASRASEADDASSGEERWGYSSDEEDSEEEDLIMDEHRPQVEDIDAEYAVSEGGYASEDQGSSGGNLPMLTGDPLFGDTRIDMEDENTAFLASEGPSPSSGPPSRQTIYLADEDSNIRFVGYAIAPVRQFLWRIACVCSLGLLALLGHWIPTLWLRFVARETAFKEIRNGFVVVETAARDIFIVKMSIINYGHLLSTVFPKTWSGLLVPSRDSGNVTPTTRSSLRPTNGVPGTPTSTASEDILLPQLQVVDFRYQRYLLDPRSGLFTIASDWRDPTWSTITAVSSGINVDIRCQRGILFGRNAIDIQGKSIGGLLVDEVIHPFYVFQIASIVLWSIDDYYYYAFCIAVISILSIATTLIDTLQTIKRLREMSRFSCPVGVLINGEWQTVNSEDLVPGDLVHLQHPDLATVPADMLIVSGDAIVNESMLTGESVPISKTPMRDASLQEWRNGSEISPDTAKSFLYTGTRIIRVRGSGFNDSTLAIALVVRTGFSTTKGALIRSMLFPKPMGFKFYRDSMRFIAVLAGIAGLGFLVSAVQFVRLGVRIHTIILRALDLITVVVPPALPATLSIGTSFAIARLRKSGIFCIAPTRVNVGGKVDVTVFDKTGTLTEDGLDILGVRVPERSTQQFGELITHIHDLPLGVGKATFLYALTTCHALKVVDGKAIGDPLDAKMFSFTGWNIEEGPLTGPKPSSKPGADRPSALVQTVVRPDGAAQFRVEDALRAGRVRSAPSNAIEMRSFRRHQHAHFLELGVIRTFDFVSALRRMSVIVKRLKSSSMEIYVKGAPEVMNDICDPDSFPRDYDDLLSYYTKRGYRVIALAGKSLDGLTWLKAQKLKREQAEAGLKFLGLIIFENKIKAGTPPAIQTLRAAHLACRMCTGDNPRTAISVGRECGMVSQTAHVFVPSFKQGDSHTPLSKLEWVCVDDETWKLDDYSLKPLTPPAQYGLDEISNQDYSLAVTGDVFRWMINYAPLETLQRMLVKAQIFARMSPDEKHELVERLQSLGYTVAFCGDGANDCGALKAADLGLSLSEAEASVAAPFTSRTPDIGCMIEVIKEGRAALVTSFSCFKYMALYSLIQFTTITLLYSFASSLGDFQFLYIDLFIIIPIAVAMGRTLPYDRIHPKRPTASLVSRKVLVSIIGQVIVTSAVQFWVFFWVRAQPWYEPPPTEGINGKLETTNFENTALFLVSSFQYILVAAVFSIGPPYRQPMWTNRWLMGSILILCGFSSVLLLAPPRYMMELLELKQLPLEGKRTLAVVVVVNVLLCIGFERWGAARVARWLRRAPVRSRLQSQAAYKVVEGS